MKPNSGQKQRTDDPVKIMAYIMSNMPMLLLRSGGAWLSFKRQAKKGSVAFQKELLNQGLDKQTARLFTDQYIESSNLIKLFMNQS
jgi:hypothetical protein